MNNVEKDIKQLHTGKITIEIEKCRGGLSNWKIKKETSGNDCELTDINTAFLEMIASENKCILTVEKDKNKIYFNKIETIYRKEL
jgi:hypothetical protein